MSLKPRIAHNVAAVLGGIFISYLGFVSAVIIGSYASIVPAIVGVLGLSWIFLGILGLMIRRRLVITIDPSGISLPSGSILRRDLRNVLVPREAMAAIFKHESIKGRMVVITLKSGYKIPVQARAYCKLKDFLSRCERAGLPVI